MKFVSAAAMVRSTLLALLAGVLLATPSTMLRAQPAHRDPGHYFLVIDHSGSMLTQLRQGPEAGRTRWDLMRERAAAFADRLPQGAEAWAVIFDAADRANPNREWHKVIAARLDNPTNRTNFTGLIKTFPEPGPANGTWLHDATEMALRQVEIAGARNPDAYLTVLVYTDGVDEGHGRTRAEIVQSKGSSITREQLDARVRQLRQRFRNFNILNVYQPGDESIRDAHVIRLLTNRVQLASPLMRSKQEFALEFSFRDDERLKLVGRPLSLRLESHDGPALPLRLTGGPFQMQDGKLVIGVELAGSWPAGQGQDVKARLKIDYPKIDGSFLVAEGGDTVDLLIQGAEEPAIRNLLPASGVFPVGREISFSLTTLAGAVVDWDFGDGKAARGNPVTHAFSEPGKRLVTVKATDPRTNLTATSKIPIEVARLAIKLDPLAGSLMPDKPVVLTATTDGAFERFEWNVDGKTYAGTIRKDGVPGTALALTFERTGPVRVSVAGDGKHGGRVETRPETLTVKEIPTLRVTSPAVGDTLYFAKTREFRAEVEGINAQCVRFTLTAADGSEVLPPKEVDVSQQGSVRLAMVVQKIPALKGKVAATLRAEAVGTEQPLVREFPVTLEREPTTLEIELPEGPEPQIHRATPLRLESNASITSVRWDFGDGSPRLEGNTVERHTWTRYGDFVLRAWAKDPEGKDVESAPMAIKVRVRPVQQVNAVLVYEGKVVGRDIDRVPINATLQLKAESTGDLQRLRWFLDGEAIPDGQDTLLVRTRGERKLRLLAEGTPEAGSAESVVVFRTSDPFAFWLGFGAIAVLLVGLGRLLIGNQWRFAEFRVKTSDAESWRKPGSNDPCPDANPRRLSAWPSRKRETYCGWWNPLTKRAFLSIESLDNQLQHSLDRNIEAGIDFKWTEGDVLEFTGTDKPKFRGRFNNRVELQYAGSEKDFNLGGVNPCVRCWIVPRSGIPSRRADGSRFQPNYSQFALYLYRSRRAVTNWPRRYWQEIFYALLLIFGLFGVRVLHTNFY